MKRNTAVGSEVMDTAGENVFCSACNAIRTDRCNKNQGRPGHSSVVAMVVVVVAATAVVMVVVVVRFATFSGLDSRIAARAALEFTARAFIYRNISRRKRQPRIFQCAREGACLRSVIVNRYPGFFRGQYRSVDAND